MLSKSVSLTQPIPEPISPIKRVLILDGLIIKILVIDTQAKIAIKLLNKKNRSIYKRFERSYETIDQMNFNICIQSFQFYWL